MGPDASGAKVGEARRASLQARGRAAARPGSGQGRAGDTTDWSTAASCRRWCRGFCEAVSRLGARGPVGLQGPSPRPDRGPRSRSPAGVTALPGALRVCTPPQPSGTPREPTGLRGRRWGPGAGVGGCVGGGTPPPSRVLTRPRRCRPERRPGTRSPASAPPARLSLASALPGPAGCPSLCLELCGLGNPKEGSKDSFADGWWRQSAWPWGRGEP